MCLEYFNFIWIRQVLFNCFDSCPLNARNHSQKCLSLIIQKCSRMGFFISQLQKLHKNVGGTGILSCFYYDLLVKLMKCLLSTNLQDLIYQDLLILYPKCSAKRVSNACTSLNLNYIHSHYLTGILE